MKTNAKLQKIAEKYKEISYNKDNYNIGGGLSDVMHCSLRYEDAKNDNGKLTLGEAVRLFSKATGLPSETVKEIIWYHYEYEMEWHHAGRLPKSGKMRKVYFLNSEQIVEIAQKWDFFYNNFINKENKQKIKHEFLKNNATFILRVLEKPPFFICTHEEMHGKYGWFPASYKYNLPIYYSGWQFQDKEKYEQYLSM